MVPAPFRTNFVMDILTTLIFPCSCPAVSGRKKLGHGYNNEKGKLKQRFCYKQRRSIVGHTLPPVPWSEYMYLNELSIQLGDLLETRLSKVKLATTSAIQWIRA
jgi:hypothetical protein